MARPEYQERMIKEKHLIKDKIEKLDMFMASDLFDNLNETDQGLLMCQQEAMSTYSEILSLRIHRLK